MPNESGCHWSPDDQLVLLPGQVDERHRVRVRPIAGVRVRVVGTQGDPHGVVLQRNQLLCDAGQVQRHLRRVVIARRQTLPKQGDISW